MNIKQLGVGVGVVMTMALVAACGGGEGSNANLYDELTAAESSAIVTACECYQLGEFGSSIECIEDFTDELTADETACVRAVYEANQAALQAQADCTIAAFEDVEACFNAVVECDEAAHDACFSSIDDALNLCPDPTPSVQTALDDCEDDAGGAT